MKKTFKTFDGLGAVKFRDTVNQIGFGTENEPITLT